MRAYPVTHTGLVREQNEDTVRVAEGACGLYILADGMGGHLAGEVASRMTADEMEKRLFACAEPSTEIMREAIQQTNAIVYEKQLTEPEMHGMGTTLTALWEGREHVYIGHVGDSRAYLFRDGVLRQMTEDHSMVGELLRAGAITAEQARNHPRRNVITQAVGTDISVQPDVFQIIKTPGDIWLLCSDGLTDMVEDAFIAQTMAENAPAAATQLLLDEALKNGGKDNVSVMLLEVEA
ncbi:MAG: Stp1/IreP family PP2C-type Ser/Thr phosphatase [Clostridia bacterium]|nr:Stp1/IreP family PP2C-type Ser/Thr phosphatase [Clostridia bacterium]